MASSDWYTIPCRPHIKIDDELLDEGFVKNALVLADQDPQRSGVFFSEFLTGYYKQIALGKCKDIGDTFLGTLSEDGDTIAWDMRRDMFLGASQAYHQCHRLRHIYESLQAVMISPPTYLESLLQSLRYAYEEQALLAAWRVRHIKSVGRFYEQSRERATLSATEQ
ncbi:hypothetical protein D7B24_001001 [Verticillium nonalfalfae]|uniref:Uncharacterized protein n=2 Tax=Verticillium TaxID=1036719 RepID=A0A444RJ30_VERDA|nr:uncharacterized protein D7B24_001001 [Verticillium nonalfalfae]PNH41688.1 hypothetical protein VD0004_g5477 [Verticillium dahliae]PNH72200.1 hypothetical protein VD0001_g5342 [Verticillium dahliae]RNJ54026.1 hypothetical protein D7B24_001001 [Verticillium nonalfalfae]RXG41201.1 hypothetical protein VDGE_30514 [Verticillium dahliae]